jgi:phospholipase/lecithinase/hemolysin
MYLVRAVVVGLALFGALTAPARANGPGGIGVLGDSYSDEYQFYPPDRSTAKNWVEILAESRGLNFGRFSSQSRGEPRNKGFEYNWARSDATSDDLIATGQHTGLAAQVRSGEVSLVWVFIGGNDFINALKSPQPVDTLRSVLPRAITNYQTAFKTIFDASPNVRLVLVTIPDIRNLLEFSGPLRDGKIAHEVADAFTAAIQRFNSQIRWLAWGNRRIALQDFDLAVKLANAVSLDYAPGAGVRLDRRVPSNDPRHLFLADTRHPGTIGQALMAQLFIDTVNARFGLRITPLRDSEIRHIALSVPDWRPSVVMREQVLADGFVPPSNDAEPRK